MAHDTVTQPTEDRATEITVTHHTSHIAACPHIAAFQVINPEITVGHTHYYPTDLQGMNHIDHIHTLAGLEGHIPKGT